MKRFLLVIFLFSCPVLLGMDADDKAFKAEVLKIQSLIYSNPTQAYIESAALALETSEKEIKSRAVLNESEVQTVECVEGADIISYFALLENGDTVRANFFVEGPLKGRYHCARNISKRFLISSIPLNNNVYHRLAAIYKTTSMNRATAMDEVD